MWRSASLYIGFSGVLWLRINLLAQLSKEVWWYWYALLTKNVRSISYIILGIMCTFCGFLYVASRVFIVVEAFISLRTLPEAAYLSPEWAVSVPHL